jgi:hypothetical protein
MKSFQLAAILAVVGLFGLLAHPAEAQNPKAGPRPNPVQKSGKYRVELRIPPEGLYAEEEIDIEFRITDTSQEDPVQGALPVVRAVTTANLTMPSMPSMPNQVPKTHTEGVPGDYGVICFFPHGGEYQLDLTITPPKEEAFTVSFRFPVQDTVPINKRKPKPKPFLLEVATRPARAKAGEPVELRLRVRNRTTREIVKSFDVVHEQLMHLLIVSRDLSQFAHEHPEMQPNGDFILRYTFPTGGDYRLFADMAPKEAGAQVIVQTIKVDGPAPRKETYQVSNQLETSEGVQAMLTNPLESLVARRAMDLVFTLKEEKTGAPVTNLEPWLGAIAHLIMIHEDATTFVHSHPDETDPQNGREGRITMMARFPRPGLYRGWLQFQRSGKIVTLPFAVTAKESAE